MNTNACNLHDVNLDFHALYARFKFVLFLKIMFYQ